MLMATTSTSRPEHSRDRDRRLILVLALGTGAAVATALTVWACARSSVLVQPTATALWRGSFVASYAGVGMYAWWRRPESRLGPLFMVTALLYSLVSLNAFDNSLAFTLGMTFWVANIVNVAYVYLCFPRGRLESRIERRFILALASSTTLVWAAILLLSPTLPAAGVFNDCGTRCPSNALQIVTGHAATGAALATVFSVVFTIGLLGLGMLIFNKSRSSTHLLRRALTPLTAVFLLMLAQFVVALFVAAAYPETRATFKVINGVLSLAIPASILVGQIRGNVFAAVSLGQIAVRAGGRSMTPAGVQRVIGDALGDSSLALALWDSRLGHYVDVDGAPVEIPRDTRTRGVTRVTQSGRPLAALIHDPSLDTEADVVEGLAATSLMLLENTRLVQELRASRARIVEAADRERTRLEHDLHDGAQQRLVAIQIRLGMARESTNEEEVAQQLDMISDEAQAALDELRALAHGGYLGALEELGPVAALRALAHGSVVPIQVTDGSIRRLPRALEAALYFCAREAIQNASKHAGPGANVTVTLAHHEDGVVLTVVDDGAGLPPGAEDGTGIVGMSDRIEAVGGQFEIVSTPGRGTTIRATVPDSEPAPVVKPA
jgi:signal transduction histidine kinase